MLKLFGVNRKKRRRTKRQDADAPGQKAEKQFTKMSPCRSAEKRDCPDLRRRSLKTLELSQETLAFSPLDDSYLSYQRLGPHSPSALRMQRPVEREMLSAPPSARLSLKSLSPRREEYMCSVETSVEYTTSLVPRVGPKSRRLIRTNPWVSPKPPMSPFLDWQSLTPSPRPKTPDKLDAFSPDEILSSSGYSSHDSSPESSLHSPRWAQPFTDRRTIQNIPPFTETSPRAPPFYHCDSQTQKRRSIAEQEKSMTFSVEDCGISFIDECEKVDKCVECSIEIDQDSASDCDCDQCDENGNCDIESKLESVNQENGIEPEFATDCECEECDPNGNPYWTCVPDEADILLAELDRKLARLHERTQCVALSARRATDEFREYSRSREMLNRNKSMVRSLRLVIQGTEVLV